MSRAPQTKISEERLAVDPVGIIIGPFARHSRVVASPNDRWLSDWYLFFSGDLDCMNSDERKKVGIVVTPLCCNWRVVTVDF